MRASILALVFAGCAAPAAPAGRLDERTMYPDRPPLAPFDDCTVYTAREVASSAEHVPTCSAIAYPRHPPSGGPHYGAWPAFGTHDAPIPWGYLVHALEHGAIVLAYRCEGACPEIVAALEAIVAARGPDPICRASSADARFVIVPDPELDHAIAAVAWEHLYLATCLDPPSLEAWIEEHYGRGPEAVCAPGIERPAEGWCP